MKVLGTIKETRSALGGVRAKGQSIGLVPTMGALHAGHRSLAVATRRRCDFVVVSIFVNPTQFGPGEDFDRYPRTLDADLDACRDDGVNLVFHPDVAQVYPGRRLTTVHVSRITECLCGRHRPGHFDGVTTVVAKLFEIVRPDLAFFGEKDYQQLVVIRRMAADLNMPVEIVGCPTVREPDGLAMSSRNQYLTDAQRRQATVLYRSMCGCAKRIRSGELEAAALMAGIEEEIRASGPVEIDYVAILDPDTLESVQRVDGPARICLAVRIGKCRLIDNLAVDGSGRDG
ncbi:MAG TPA: pantoate--beta-alanine ligase [Phycisphaerae bacterium]|nr:pantoate--beta-alanine ligase [Phycisphaerae bacterium]